MGYMGFGLADTMNNSLLDHDVCINILLIEDNEDDYIFIKEVLDGISETRFQIDWVDTYEAGMESCHDSRYDVFLIDYSLGNIDNGGKNGIELMRDLFCHGCNKQIIILTGQEDRNIDVEAMNAGAFDYLVKGEIEPSVLERAICYAFSRGKIENLLREKENHYKAILDNIDEYIYIKDIPEELFPYGRIHFISSRVKTITGYDAAEFISDPNFMQRIVHPDDFRQFKKEVIAQDTGSLAEPSIMSFEFRVRHKNTGEYRWMEDKIVPHYDDSRRLIGYIGVVRDVAERRMFEDQLKHDALHDKLTGLPNRILFLDRLRNAISRIKRRSDYQFAVLFIDLDRFKNINDAMGHTCGDKLLIAVTERLRTFVRPSDTVARLGGDEFAILLDEVPYVYDATFVADRIQGLLSTPVMIDNYEMFSTASIGIALSTSGYQHPEEMLRDADTAMYKAKSEGRARYEVFDMEMHAQATSILKLETDLRRALERKEFELHYQPIYRLSDGMITSFEALLRWRHPEQGLIPPSSFIPIAEETGLIIPIGQWVIEEACKKMREWKSKYQDYPLQFISVNLSARQFSQIDLIEYIDYVINENGLRPENLKLEITESVVMENAECISAILFQFKSMGIPLSMDDFGTGYSSLSYLHRLPIDTLKIDRSFISRINGDHGKVEIVETIIALAHNLGLDVVAEGLETRTQLSKLLHLGCEYGQGFFLSKPVTAQDVESLLVGGDRTKLVKKYSKVLE